MRTTNAAKPSTSTIDFREEIATTSNDKTVSQILSRLDQLQNKIGGTPEATPKEAAPKENSKDLQSRITTLEKIHEDVLQKLASKLENLERRIAEKREAEPTEHLVEKLASKFSQVEARLHSATKLDDRVARLESQLQAHAAHPERISKLEAHLAPEGEYEKVLHRINSKIDTIEKAKRSAPLAAETSKQDQIKYLQDRVERLQQLKTKYLQSEE